MRCFRVAFGAAWETGNLNRRFAHREALYPNTAADQRLTALADLYSDALDAPSRTARLEAFKRLGDVALFVAGLFSAALRRKPVGVDYYVSMGQGAYGTIADNEILDSPRFAGGSVYGELANKFVGFVDVLDEVGERASTRSDQDLVHSYERWVSTGSNREKKKLERQGVVPFPARGRYAQH